MVTTGSPYGYGYHRFPIATTPLVVIMGDMIFESTEDHHFSITTPIIAASKCNFLTQ